MYHPSDVDSSVLSGIASIGECSHPAWKRDQPVQGRSPKRAAAAEDGEARGGLDLDSRSYEVQGDENVEHPDVARLRITAEEPASQTAVSREVSRADSFDHTRLTIRTDNSPDSKRTPMRPSELLRGDDSFYEHHTSNDLDAADDFSPVQQLSSMPFQGAMRPKQFRVKSDEIKEEHTGPSYRFLDRAAPFHQSHGHLNFFRGVSRETEMAIRRLYFTDWYHTFLNLRLRFQLLLFFFAYISLWMMFAIFIYLVPSDHCDLQVVTFLDAYYLSIETLETIGYGVPSSYFKDPVTQENCWEMAIILSCQAMITTIFNALVIGVIFSRMSRPQSRASTIVFSSTALIQYNADGAPHLIFRIADLRRHQLIEGHIRCYCVVHDNSSSDDKKGISPGGPSFQRSGMQVYPMRLNQPDDTLGGMLLLTTPQFVIHRIDPWSPLSPYFKPLELRPFKRNRPRNNANIPLQTNVAGGIPQRMSDNDTGNRVAFMCEVCGQEFATYPSLQKHIKYEQDQHPNYNPTVLNEPTEEQLKDYWRGKSFEVFCICEGIEPFTSSTIQARHSYLTKSDIVFGHSFFPCVRVQDDGLCLFDVTRFHKTMKAGPQDVPPQQRDIPKEKSQPHLHRVTPSPGRVTMGLERLFTATPQVIMVEEDEVQEENPTERDGTAI